MVSQYPGMPGQIIGFEKILKKIIGFEKILKKIIGFASEASKIFFGFFLEFIGFTPNFYRIRIHTLSVLRAKLAKIFEVFIDIYWF